MYEGTIYICFEQSYNEKNISTENAIPNLMDTFLLKH